MVDRRRITHNTIGYAGAKTGAGSSMRLVTVVRLKPQGPPGGKKSIEKI